ncbi:MAG: hypothetical protein PHQ23_16220 [Candidatus Wallbacteria bacterium]|nr:hypothetical protein [Candidatus Wallbacteria bacterium]
MAEKMKVREQKLIYQIPAVKNRIMIRIQRFGFIIFLLLVTAIAADACSLFVANGPDGMVAGRNFDWNNRGK